MTVPDEDRTRVIGERDAVVADVQSGDESPLSSLAEPHRRELLVHCYRILGNLDDAEDMVQETFSRAWRSRAGFEGRATFRAWLYQIANHPRARARRGGDRQGNHRAGVLGRHPASRSPASGGADLAR